VIPLCWSSVSRQEESTLSINWDEMRVLVEFVETPDLDKLDRPNP